jgi:hypothetical protein
MKAISIRQPWTWLVVDGYKDVENRTWATSYRGPVLVHAGLQRASSEGVQEVISRLDDSTKHELSEQMSAMESLPVGGVAGIVDIVDCVTRSGSHWFEGPYGFVLRNPRPITFVRYPGKLKLFDVSVESVPALAAILQRYGI